MTLHLQKQGEKSLYDQVNLIEKYRYLIDKIVGQFEDASEDKENLEEVGYIGLLNAANLYDSSIHDINFKTYAQILITEEMHQYLMNRKHRVDCPTWLVKMNKKIDEFVIRYRQEQQKFHSISEIAVYLNIHDFGVQEVLKARNSLKEVSITREIVEDKLLTNIELDLEKIKNQSYQSFKLPIEDVIILKKALKRLKKLQENIVYYLFFMDLNKTKLAKILGIPQEKADRIKKEVF
ncbi:MAG: hypothetical protein PHD33_02995, partial [Atribacterota bacterium]|nr:hypothetical protein [Atribacterota bacterium]